MDSRTRKIYFVGVCGTGMGSLALLLKAAGHDVVGSDQNVYPPMSHLLEAAGVTCYPGFSEAHLPPDIDLVVVGNAVSESNVEVRAVLKREIPYLSFPQALYQFFLKDRFPIVVTGTHGKTTTSALLAWVFGQCGLDPGFLVGGSPLNFQSGAGLGRGPFFIVEGDEYDTAFFDKRPKFLHYHPRAAVLTGVEFDHADIYKTFEDVKQAFAQFVARLPADGVLAALYGNPETDQVLRQARCRVIRYGLASPPQDAPGSEWVATAFELVRRPPGGPMAGSSGAEATGSFGIAASGVERWMRFRVFRRGGYYGAVETSLFGRHNAQNILAVLAIGDALGLDREAMLAAVSTFRGVRRRQEEIGRVNDIVIVEDFAHHPTAVYHTLDALRWAYPERRIWAVFEPRSASCRRRVFQETLPAAFSRADAVIIAGLYAPDRIDPSERLDPARVVSDLRAGGQMAYYIPAAGEIVDRLGEALKPGDLVCVMSSGGFEALPGRLLSRLREIHGP